MPKIDSITLTHAELIDVSIKMHDLSHRRQSQGYLEWLVFRSISEVKNVDLFELRPDECSCGDKKRPEDLMCVRCESYE